jgi:hypothetical protein
MSIVTFLEGSAPDARGRYIGAIYLLDDQEVENIHDFIQWIFPLQKVSQAVPGAPVLSEEDVQDIRASSKAQANLDISVDWYLGFLQRNRHWITKYDHNHLRITRVIKSIRLLVGDNEAEKFRRRVFEILGDDRSEIDLKAVSFWMDA